MIEAVHHIGIAVFKLNEAIEFYRRTFELEAERVASPPGSMLEFAIVRFPGCEIELLAETAAETPITRFLQSRGQGVHHIAFKVEDITKAMTDMQARGVDSLNPVPGPGTDDTLTCFFHPRTTMGVLYEFVQPRAEKTKGPV